MFCPLVQEVRIEVRAVNDCVAACAVTACLKTEAAVRHIGREWIDVALQAKEAFLTAHQQHSVYAAVRSVASRAALDFYGRVLEHKGPALFDVALGARFPSALA